MISFSWNPAKARSNKKKHGVSFEEAKSVFYDEFAVQFYDADRQMKTVFSFSDEQSVSHSGRGPL